MSKLIRMDHTGHSTLAEWTPDDPAAVEAAVKAFRAELDRGYLAMVSPGPVTPSRCASCRSRLRS